MDATVPANEPANQPEWHWIDDFGTAEYDFTPSEESTYLAGFNDGFEKACKEIIKHWWPQAESARALAEILADRKGEKVDLMEIIDWMMINCGDRHDEQYAPEAQVSTDWGV